MDLFYALGGAHFGFDRATMTIKGCDYDFTWSVDATMRQTDLYTFPAGFLELRTFFPAYNAAYDLENNLKVRSRFYDTEEWADSFHGEQIDLNHYRLLGA